jgi:hypothetical protein
MTRLDHDRVRAERRALLGRVLDDLDGDAGRLAEVLGVGRWRLREWLSGRTVVEDRWWAAVESLDRLMRRPPLPPVDPAPSEAARCRAAAAVLRRQRRGLPPLAS